MEGEKSKSGKNKKGLMEETDQLLAQDPSSNCKGGGGGWLQGSPKTFLKHYN
jgi:hypothetical protein